MWIAYLLYTRTVSSTTMLPSSRSYLSILRFPRNKIHFEIETKKMLCAECPTSPGVFSILCTKSKICFRRIQYFWPPAFANANKHVREHSNLVSMASTYRSLLYKENWISFVHLFNCSAAANLPFIYPFCSFGALIRVWKIQKNIDWNCDLRIWISWAIMGFCVFVCAVRAPPKVRAPWKFSINFSLKQVLACTAGWRTETAPRRNHFMHRRTCARTPQRNK